eukprot:SAG22_NODE_450_length_10398_cov_8.760171_4_plen_130_part_00
MLHQPVPFIIRSESRRSRKGVQHCSGVVFGHLVEEIAGRAALEARLPLRPTVRSEPAGRVRGVADSSCCCNGYSHSRRGWWRLHAGVDRGEQRPQGGSLGTVEAGGQLCCERSNQDGNTGPFERGLRYG